MCVCVSAKGENEGIRGPQQENSSAFLIDGSTVATHGSRGWKRGYTDETHEAGCFPFGMLPCKTPQTAKEGHDKSVQVIIDKNIESIMNFV